MLPCLSMPNKRFERSAREELLLRLARVVSRAQTTILAEKTEKSDFLSSGFFFSKPACAAFSWTWIRKRARQLSAERSFYKDSDKEGDVMMEIEGGC